MSNNFINSSLSKNEKVLHTYKLHWIVWVKVVIFGLIGLGLLQVHGLGFAGGLILLVTLFSVLGIIGTEYGVTNSRIIGKSGFIFRKNVDLRLKKVESVILDQSILGRLFGYGHVVFNGTGSGKSGFLFIDNPTLAKNQINQIIENIENEESKKN